MTAKLDLTQFEGHTPGPWEAVYQSARTKIFDAEMNNVCIVHARDKEDDNNSRLLAAAPALLALARSQAERIEQLREALQAALDEPRTVGLENQIRAALAETENY